MALGCDKLKSPGAPAWHRADGGQLLEECLPSSEPASPGQSFRTAHDRVFSSRLLQRSAKRAKVGAELGANTLHGDDNRNRDTRCDQAILDRSSPGLVFEECQNERLHGDSYPVLP